MKLMTLTFALLLSANTYATRPGDGGNKPVDFDPLKWNKIITHIHQKGETMDTPDGELRYLQSSDQDDPKFRHVEYLTLRGKYGKFSRYFAEDITLTDEYWQSEDGEVWTADQWHYYISPRGDLNAISRRRFTSRNGVISNSERVPVGPVDAPEQLQKWSDKLARWYKLSGI